MGSVYHAVDENLGVDVAVKENLFTSDEYARQFRLEAVILANLRHSNLPRVTDHFVIGEQGQYLIMDYIEGEDLRQRMERSGSITEEEAILVGAAMCDALQYLHTRKPSIIHRDVKPGNVRITPDGHIFLVDFGLAKLVKGSQATTTGARAMTPGYSPPEQYGTARTDPRTDVYSLGATLYAALTGVIPEDGLARAMDNVELTPLRKRNPKVSRKLSSAIEKAMAVRPDDRFQTADEFKQALVTSNVKTQRLDREFLVEPPPQPAELGDEEGAGEGTPPGDDGRPATPPPPKPRRKKTYDTRGWVSAGLVALAVIVVAGILGLFWKPLTQTFQRVQASGTPSINTPSALPFDTFTPVFVEDTDTPFPTRTPTNTLIAPLLPSLTPTLTPTLGPTSTMIGGGYNQIAFASTLSGLPQIYLVNTDGTGLTKLTKMSEGACQPDWSPDGLHLVFISPCPGRQDDYPDAKMYVINVDGSGLVELPSAPGGDFDPAWSPDGTRIVFTSLRDGLDHIYMMHLPDYKVFRLTDTPSDASLPDWSRQPSWSPDGTQIVYTAHSRLTGALQVWVMYSNGAGQSRVVRRDTNYWDFQPYWSPDGKTILFSETNGAQALGWLMIFDFTHRDTAEATHLRAGTFMGHGEYSPDGRWIVYESLDVAFPSSKDYFVYILQLASGNYPARLVNDSSINFGPAWRPIAAP
jgi:eukaryotic-like serine/threonine-protein kinase